MADVPADGGLVHRRLWPGHPVAVHVRADPLAGHRRPSDPGPVRLHLVLDHADAVESFTDNRIAQVARSERAALSQHQTGTQDHATELRRLVDAQRQHRNRPGGYWVASTNPDAAYQAITGTVERQQLARAALMTDGAARLVERFHLATWPDNLDLVDHHGPHALIDQVRDAEYSDPDGQRWPRGKDHDDATIALCRIWL